jgi:large subunit ribosomal protein L10
MSKAVKAMVTAELKDRYAGTDSACVVDLTGMTVQEQEELRRTLRGKSARLEVVKNSLARRAFSGGPLEPLGDALGGPCAIVTSPESAIEVSKVLVEAAKEYAELKLKYALLDGDPNILTVEELSKLKSRTEIIGELVMLISSPARSVAGCLGSPQARIAGCVKAMADKAA